LLRQVLLLLHRSFHGVLSNYIVFSFVTSMMIELDSALLSRLLILIASVSHCDLLALARVALQRRLGCLGNLLL